MYPPFYMEGPRMLGIQTKVDSAIDFNLWIAVAPISTAGGTDMLQAAKGFCWEDRNVLMSCLCCTNCDSSVSRGREDFSLFKWQEWCCVGVCLRLWKLVKRRKWQGTKSMFDFDLMLFTFPIQLTVSLRIPYLVCLEWAVIDNKINLLFYGAKFSLR